MCDNIKEEIKKDGNDFDVIKNESEIEYKDVEYFFP